VPGESRGVADTVNVGLVGLGLVSLSHLKGYQSHPGAEVVAVCDVDEEKARQFAQRHGIRSAFSSFESLLARPEIQAVDICTPTYLHVPMTLQAVAHKKHVHCEKPFCRTVGEGLTACQVAEWAGVKLAVGETYVFIASHMKARELIEAGEIGRPQQIRQRQGTWQVRADRVTGGRPEPAWRSDPEQSGGGDYPWHFDHAVHLFATAEYLMPDRAITEVYALGTSPAVRAGKDSPEPSRGSPERDIPVISWKYEDGESHGVWVRAEAGNDKYDFVRGFSTAVIGDKGMIEVLGEGGHNLLWNGEQQHLLLHRPGKEAVCFRFSEGADEIWDSEIAYYSQSHIRQIHHWVDCLVHDTKPHYGGQDGVHAVRCALAAICSAQERRPVRLAEISRDYAAYSGWGE
jgi:UDP-N-acetylglucosamine 3-dehydrogenase